ncbi:PREDICTED: tumor necrosis factor alpha-induced protein 2-like [Nanorana parkeri]|uniref:tumor necrosis factor alpha-induced protein 2-like n=1 Tax=Nanorana parkeri TaxID=125878 RepID=UPI000854EB3D|nr:PREDICTED: tumor necrosis factor alpha-induced protein 2-like [Nanorana parkeri]
MAADRAKEIPENGAKKKRKKWYKRVMNTIIPTACRMRSSDLPEDIEITAEDIQKLIEDQQYQNASQRLIKLEHKIFSKSEEPTSEEKKELGSLYEKLKAAVFQVIKESLTSTDEESLQQAVQAIVEQETEDSQLKPDLNNSNRSRPGRWMEAWKECVKQNVEERLKNLPQKKRPKESSSFISVITDLALVYKTDLIHVVKDLKKCYPEQFDVCNTYAQHYHQIMKMQIEQITQFEMLDKDNYILLCWVQNLYPKYKNQFAEYVEKNRNQIFYRATCITHLNCCLFFRQFIKGKESKLSVKERLDMLSLLLQLEDTIHNALLRDLFADLKAMFKKMSQGSSPFSYSTMQTIISASEDFFLILYIFSTVSLPVFSGKIHLYLVKEHLSRILKRKASNKTIKQMQTLSNQIRENADLINAFSVSYRSCEDWLKPALPNLAEIIELQDLNAIQLQVAKFVELYPDIRNKQIEAILYMKGNLSRSEVKVVLKAVDSLERKINEKHKLFVLI